MAAKTLTKTTVAVINRGHGSIEVHRANCRDLARDAEGASIWTVDARDFRDVVLDIYPPSDFNYADGEWESYSGDVVMMPCTPTLAHDHTVDATPPAPRTGRYNSAYAHAYRAARRAREAADAERYPVLITMS